MDFYNYNTTNFRKINNINRIKVIIKDRNEIDIEIKSFDKIAKLCNHSSEAFFLKVCNYKILSHKIEESHNTNQEEIEFIMTPPELSTNSNERKRKSISEVLNDSVEGNNINNSNIIVINNVTTNVNEITIELPIINIVKDSIEIINTSFKDIGNSFKIRENKNDSSIDQIYDNNNMFEIQEDKQIEKQTEMKFFYESQSIMSLSRNNLELLENNLMEILNFKNITDEKSFFNIDSANSDDSANNSFNSFYRNNIIENEKYKEEITYSDKSINIKLNKMHSFLDKNINQHKNSLTIINKKLTNKTSNKSIEVLNLELELKESKVTIETMKTIINNLKSDLEFKVNKYKKDSQEKIIIQKNEFDNLSESHSAIIYNLTSENKKLELKIEEYIKKLDEVEQINNYKTNELKENFEIILKKNKDILKNEEDMNRKSLDKMIIIKIKKECAQELESEIAMISLLNKHEIVKLKKKMNEEMSTQISIEALKNEIIIKDIKVRHLNENENVFDLQEKNLILQERIKQNQIIENEINDDNKNLILQLAEESQRNEKLRENDKTFYENQFSIIEKRNYDLLIEKDKFYNSKFIEYETKYELLRDEIEKNKNKHEIDKEIFFVEKSSEFEKKSKETIYITINDLDRNFCNIIKKLGEETLKERKQMQLEFERKSEELNKAYIKENEELREKNTVLSLNLAAEIQVKISQEDKLKILTNKLLNYERENSNQVYQLENIKTNYKDLNTKYQDIIKDYNREKLDLELEYSIKFQDYESEIRLTKDKLDSLKIYSDLNLNEAKNQFKNEILKIEEKIKKTLFNREEIIKRLNQEMLIKEITVKKYEKMLVVQRKELLNENIFKKEM